ncbi:MAG: putative addiction module antidote protein [Propionibacteriaceae bacterium]|nr:putative addiction module antidote protein [Propionibacteriaceae bacterium]
MSVKTSPWDVCEYLATAEDIVAYLNAALEDNDPNVLQAALGDVARAQGMTRIANRAGVGRESLYKSLHFDGTPSFKTITKVAQALGVRIVFEVNPDVDAVREREEMLAQA